MSHSNARVGVTQGKKAGIFFVAAILMLLATMASSAHAYPASYWTTKTMTVPVSECVNAALKAIKQSGLTGIGSDSMSAGGVTPTTRGYIVCVRLPRAGGCNGDGATAVIVTAGSDAKALLNKIVGNLGIPTFIDCGSVGNPVNN